MSSNKYREHLVVIPEDDANREMAIGFLLDRAVRTRAVQVEPVAGGWPNVVARFNREIASTLPLYQKRYVVLMIDFDNKPNRSDDVLGQLEIPAGCEDRVFVLGVQSEPEDLRTALHLPLESIGTALAAECREGTITIWGHDLLRGNLGTLQLIRQSVCPFLFAAP